MNPFLVAALTVLGALLIRAGYAASATALVRSKNSAGMVTRHLMDAAVALLAFWAVGWAIASSGGTVLGLRFEALFGIGARGQVPAGALAVILIGAGILPGVVAERARFWPGLIATAVTAGLILPIAYLWQDGWLARIGYRDAAGAGWIHLAGAAAAAVAASFVGPRTGKFNRDGSSTAIPGHSVPLAGVGAFLQLAGFVLFAGGAGGAAGGASPYAAGNVLLAAAAGALAAALLSQSRYYKPDCHLIAAGMLGALVAVSAGPDALPSAAAVGIGAAAGVLVPLALLAIDLRLRLDDPTGGVAIHGVGAAIGLALTPLCSRGLTIGERLKQFGGNAAGVVALTVLAGGLAFLTWTLLKRVTALRAREADEFDGLDLAEHDIGAYPDFQQTMIKSYHLREV